MREYLCQSYDGEPKDQQLVELKGSESSSWSCKLDRTNSKILKQLQFNKINLK